MVAYETTRVYRASPSLLRVAFGLLLGFLGHYAVSSVLYPDRLSSKVVVPSTHVEPTYWNDNIQTHFFPLVALWAFSALDWGRKGVLLFTAGLSYLAFKDFSTTVSTRRADRAVLLWAYLVHFVSIASSDSPQALIFNYFLVWVEWYSLYIIFVPVFMFLLIPFRMELTGETKGFLRATSLIHWGLMSCVFSLSHIAYLVLLPVANAQGGAAGNLVFLVTVSEAADLAHWAWNQLLGRRFPWRIVAFSSRTWIGAVGALITCTGIAYLSTPYITVFSRNLGTLLGFLIGVGSLVGGISLSCLKRSLQAKPEGEAASFSQRNVALVRAFSLIFTAPVYFHWIRYMYT